MKKKIFSIALLAVMGTSVFMTSCGDSSGNAKVPDQQEETATIALGYDLASVGLRLNSTQTSEKKLGYQDININGSCTEVYGTADGKDVAIVILQAFYKGDLNDKSVLVDGKVYSQNILSENIVYDDSEFVVVDISDMIYANTMEERILNLGFDHETAKALQEELKQSISDLGNRIIKNKAGNDHVPEMSPEKDTFGSANL